MSTSPDATLFESSHVHTVYNAIASDFSRTRHSRWPFVERFLESLEPKGSLVLDAGTGNGKYLGVKSVVEWDGKREGSVTGEKRGKSKGKGKQREDGEEGEKKGEESQRGNDLLSIGFDMSEGLLGIASGRGHEVVRGDCVDMSCWRRGAFNHAISIATIHHFATPERRMESIKQMILAVLPSSPPAILSSSSSNTCSPRESRLLIVVWSLEQDPSLQGARSARRTTGGKNGAIEINNNNTSEDRQDEDEMMGKGKEGKDVFVPWQRQEQVPRKLKEPKKPKIRDDRNASGSSGGRQRGESRKEEKEKELSLRKDIENLSIKDDTKQPIVTNPSTTTDATRPETSKKDEEPVVVQEEEKPTFNRYYHLFSHYELSTLVQRAAKSLDLEFSYPEEYTLSSSSSSESDQEEGENDSVGKKDKAEGGEGEWKGYVRLEEERWERENWVVEVAVGYRRL